MKKILPLFLLILFSCEKVEIFTETDFNLSGTVWTMYKEEIKEERVGVDGTIRERATYWHCTPTALGESCTLVTLNDQWKSYRDDDVIHDVVYKTTGRIEFTENSVRVHLKRSYNTVFGEFPMKDVNLEEEYSINGRNGTTGGGYYFSVSEDENTLQFNGDVYTSE